MGEKVNLRSHRGPNAAEIHEKHTNPWADLVIAILSVNKYPLEKTLLLYHSLEKNGLFDPRNLSSWNHEEIAKRLGASGYLRGAVLAQMFTIRISSLGVLAKEIKSNERILAKGTREEVSSLLKEVKGVGPAVLDNYFLLRGD